MASWIISITVVVNEKWDEGPRVNHDKFNHISTAHKHQKRLHMGVRLVHVCGCEAQQNRINRLMRMHLEAVELVPHARGCLITLFFTLLASTSGSAFEKKQNTRVP